MTTDIINNINLGTVMPFFAFNINTSHICKQEDVNKNNGCILAGQPGYLDDNDGYRWMKLSSIKTVDIPVNSEDSSYASQYPAALQEPQQYNLTKKWITDAAANNGSTICQDYIINKEIGICSGFDPHATCGECGGKDHLYSTPVCDAKITGINAAESMINVPKPWYSKSSSYTYLPGENDDWPTSDPQGNDCGALQRCEVPLGSSTAYCMADKSTGGDNGHCKVLKNTCVGTTTGNVQLRGVKKLYQVTGANKDIDIGIAGVIVDCNNDSSCAKGGTLVNETTQNVGGKFIKQINEDCFDPTKIAYGNAYYGISDITSLTLPNNGNIQNQPSALDTPDWTNQPTNGFDLAINYTDRDLFLVGNNYEACEGQGGSDKCSYVGGIGNLLYMPPARPDDNKIISWISTFKTDFIGIQTKTNPIKLPEFLLPWVLTMATLNIMPRYLVTNLFGMYNTKSSQTVAGLAAPYKNLHNDYLSIFQDDLSGTVENIKKFTDQQILSAFQLWDNTNGEKLFNSLDTIVSGSYYQTGSSLKNFLITAGESNAMTLTVTLPIDIAMLWLDNEQEDLSSTARESLAYFFGENNQELTQTTYTFLRVEDANFVDFGYTPMDGVSVTTGTKQFDFKDNTSFFKKIDDFNNIQTRIYYSIPITVKICQPSIITFAYVIMTNPLFGSSVSCEGSSGITGCQETEIIFPSTTEDCIKKLYAQDDFNTIRTNIPRWCSNYSDSYPRSDGIEKYVLNSKSDTCMCYNSHLSTDTQENDELSICFSKSCSLDPDRNLRKAFGFNDSKCQDDTCATLKSLFENETLPPNIEDIDAGRVQKLCKFNPYNRNYSYNKKVLLPVLNVSIFLVCLAYILLRKHEEPLTIIVMIILVLTVLSGFLLASSPAACVKRSNLPQNRISRCKTPIGIELPEEYCGQKLDYCEASYNNFYPNRGCPTKCCPYSTGCSNKCNEAPKDKSKIIAGKGDPTFYTRRNKLVIILSSLLFIGTAIILGILNFKLDKNNKIQYIVSAIILIVMLGILIRNIVGFKTVASIYGCNATD